MTQSVPEKGTESAPDWQYWARMSGWRVAEAAALLLELDPDRHSSDEGDGPATGPNKEYFRLKRLLMRARTMDELESPMLPRDLLEWAISNDIPVPKPLLDAVSADRQLRNWKKQALKSRKKIKELKATQVAAADLPAKSLNSLYKIMLAMAEEKYGFDASKHNSAASNITRTLEKREFLEPKEQTVRDWLYKAHEAVRT